MKRILLFLLTICISLTVFAQTKVLQKKMVTDDKKNKSIIIPDKQFSERVNTPEDTFNISFTISGAENSFVSLAYHLGNKQFIKDTIQTDGSGSALYAGNKKLDPGLYMIVMPDNNFFELIITDDQEFSFTCNKNDFVNTLRFSGSAENSSFVEYRNKWSAFQKEATELRQLLDTGTNNDEDKEQLEKQIKMLEEDILTYIQKQAKSFHGSVFSALLYSMLPLKTPDFDIPSGHSNPDSLRWVMTYQFNKKHFFDNLNLNDPRLIRTPIIYNKFRSFFSNLVIQAPDSLIKEIRRVVEMTESNSETFRYAIVFLFNHFRESQIMGHDAILVMLADEYYLNGKAEWVDDEFIAELKNDIAKVRPNLIGKTATDLSMETFGGLWKAVHDIRSEFTILYFWEPDCGHCKTTTPMLLKYYTENKNNGIEVFSICTTDDKDEWENYIVENNLEWINGWDPLRTTHYDFYYNINSTPMIYILNREKTIIAKKIPVENIGRFIDNYKRLFPDL